MKELRSSEGLLTVIAGINTILLVGIILILSNMQKQQKPAPLTLRQDTIATPPMPPQRSDPDTIVDYLNNITR